MTTTSLIHFSECRRALGVDSNRTLKRAFARFGIPVVELSSRTKGLRPDDFERLLNRASGKETI